MSRDQVVDLDLPSHLPNPLPTKAQSCAYPCPFLPNPEPNALHASLIAPYLGCLVIYKVL